MDRLHLKTEPFCKTSVHLCLRLRPPSFRMPYFVSINWSVFLRHHQPPYFLLLTRDSMHHPEPVKTSRIPAVLPQHLPPHQRKWDLNILLHLLCSKNPQPRGYRYQVHRRLVTGLIETIAIITTDGRLLTERSPRALYRRTIPLVFPVRLWYIDGCILIKYGSIVAFGIAIIYCSFRWLLTIDLVIEYVEIKFHSHAYKAIGYGNSLIFDAVSDYPILFKTNRN